MLCNLGNDFPMHEMEKIYSHSAISAENNYSFIDLKNNLVHHLTWTNPENNEILSQTRKI